MLLQPECHRELRRTPRGNAAVAGFRAVAMCIMMRKATARNVDTRATDLVENVTPDTPGTNWALRLLFRAIGMWNRPAPAPEYRIAWGDRALVRDGLERSSRGISSA